ncbi:SLATT domain-containing protein [Methyloversatilis discipulorum]|uniref:SLATT domain-containing protein n=1 Tax=Methyloversatilis discipulorum TaxID=1119528 RepID=UPI003F2C04A7
MSGVPYTVEVLDKLRWNAHLGKHKHFEAGARGRTHHVSYGIPIILINVLLGSVLFAFLGDDKAFPQWAKWGGAVLSLIAAGLGGVQTFFNFEKQYMEHRAVGNEYLGIARECERVLALYFDGLLSLQALSHNIEHLNAKYAEVNTRAEALTVRATEYEAALAVQQRKKAEETSLLERYTQSISSDLATKVSGGG